MGKQDSKRSHVLFISYSNENQGIAEAICGAFEADNIPCWIAPRDVHAGRPYPGQITQAIREARILLLVLTEAANRSKHVLREVERAAHCQSYCAAPDLVAVGLGSGLHGVLEPRTSSVPSHVKVPMTVPSMNDARAPN